MHEYIARENIKRFRKLLETEQDPERQKTLRELLNAEERRLSDLLSAGPEPIVDQTSGQPGRSRLRQQGPDPGKRPAF